MLNRRRFLQTVSASFLAVPRAAGSQPLGRVYRIGVLEVVGAAANAENLSAFRQGLSELGYVEGQNFVMEYRSADGRTERLQDLASELVRLQVDVIVTRGTPAALSAKQATGTIPIVMASSGEPAAEGVVASLARPGGNVTGLHIMAPAELGGKRLQLLKEVVPSISRVGILWNSADIQSPLIVRDTERVARAMGLQLKSLEMQRPRGDKAFGQAFEAALMVQVDALIAVEDYLTLNDRARIVEFAAMSRLPALYGLREFVDAGGLMSYGTDRRDLFRRCALYLHRILQGARPADLPVEPPIKFELAINLKTARGARADDSAVGARAGRLPGRVTPLHQLQTDLPTLRYRGRLRATNAWMRSRAAGLVRSAAP
jgi:putative tryptophan/tyrosine transport system substrate-binding protein